jgi:predicted flap endonuclease-1-like 5' DNA nuclease
MNLDLQTLSSDALLYMLLHSGVFVLILGLAFFIIGMLFGRATWGRYKQQARNMAAEIEMQRGELATLKRKLGEHTVRAGSTPMATETFTTPSPEVSDTPHREAEKLSPESTQAVISPASSADAPVSHDIHLEPNLPATDTLDVETSEKSKPLKQRHTIKVKPTEPTAAAESPLSAPVASTPLVTTSPLAAIIAPQPSAVASKDKPTAHSLAADSAMMDIIPALPEIPPTPPATEITPEIDPRLGLVFKSRPPQSDDLTTMKGIAKVLEQRLHEFGIYTYHQIALWDENQIKEFSSRLAFKDRIHREKWVEQAKKLHAEKHGSAA